MKQSKNRFLTASVAAALAAMLATASILSGCGGSGDEESNETKVVTETQVVTRVVNGVYTDEEGNIIKDEDGHPMTAPSGTPDSDEKEKNENEVKDNKSSDSKSSENKSSDSSSSDSKSSDSKSSDNKSSDSKSSDSKSSGSKSSDSKSSDSKSSKTSKSEGGGDDALKVGGESFSVGDTITCTYYVTSPDCFVNYQATLNYDSSVLKATNAKMQGDASSGSVVNYKLDGKVKFNGVNLSTYDFTDGGKFMVVTYEVIGTGSTSPEISWEIVTDENYKPMVENGDLKSSFKVTESWE